jgi:hypothetical protein
LWGESKPDFEKLWPSAAQASSPHPRKTQTQLSLTKLIAINLQFFKKVMFFN